MRCSPNTAAQGPKFKAQGPNSYDLGPGTEDIGPKCSILHLVDSQRDAALIHDTLRAEGVVCRLAHELANATFLLKPFTTEKLLATVNGVLHPPKLLAP